MTTHLAHLRAWSLFPWKPSPGQGVQSSAQALKHHSSLFRWLSPFKGIFRCITVWLIISGVCAVKFLCSLLSLSLFLLSPLFLSTLTLSVSYSLSLSLSIISLFFSIYLYYFSFDFFFLSISLFLPLSLFLSLSLYIYMSLSLALSLFSLSLSMSLSSCPSLSKRVVGLSGFCGHGSGRAVFKLVIFPISSLLTPVLSVLSLFWVFFPSLIQSGMWSSWPRNFPEIVC